MLEIVRKSLLELEGNSPAHDPDTVHGVHQCLGISLQYVALCQFNHELFFSWPIAPCPYDCHNETM